MDRCPKCGFQEGDQLERPVTKPVPADFTDKCFMMLKGELKEHERKFIQDCQKRTELSEKQLKWWSAIHKNCFGDWPSSKAKTPAKLEPPHNAQEWEETLSKTF